MFEGNFQDAGFADAVENAALQPLEWQMLVTKLAAARDLRSVYSQRKTARGGNFACFSSGQTENLNKTALGINRNASADRKGLGAIVPAAADEAETGDRE